MSNILVIYEGKVTELSNVRALLDYAISLLTKADSKGEAVPKEQKVGIADYLEKDKAYTDALLKKEQKDAPISKKGKEALDKITAPEKGKSEQKAPNTYDLPPMRKPFFGGKDKGEMLSFSYFINGEVPHKQPANVSRCFFVKTEAFRDLPAKDQRVAMEWGLTLLKKQIRASGGEKTTASLTTKMLQPFSMDRFNLMAGQTITFTVKVKE